MPKILRQQLPEDSFIKFGRFYQTTYAGQWCLDILLAFCPHVF